MTWKVVESHSPPGEELITKSSVSYGLKDFNIGNYKKSEVLAHMFLELMFLDWKDMVNKMNVAVAASKAKCKKFSNEEFLIGLGIIMGAAEFSQKGVDLFSVKNMDDDDDEELNQWPSISPSPQFEQYMVFSRFKDFRRFLPSIFADESKKENDPWWEFSGAVEEFNLIRSTKVICSPWISIDETMCAWRPRTTALGGLPNISFIVRTPEPLGKIKIFFLVFMMLDYGLIKINLFYPTDIILNLLGTEFKTAACHVTGVLRHMEIQRGKEGMKTAQFNNTIGATAGCTLRLLLNSIPVDQQGAKHGVRGDAWFGSVNTANEVSIRGHKGVFQVKQFHTLFPKEYIEEVLKEAPGGVHIVLKGTTRDERNLVAIGYRYSHKTILHFVLTENAGSTGQGDPYEMKYTDSYGNICTRYVDRPDVISKFFASSNVIDTHNQLRQDLLQLEKKWLTKNPFFRLTTTLIGINVMDTFLLASHHKVINLNDATGSQKLSIRRFAGMLAFQLIRQAKKLGALQVPSFLPEDDMLPVVSITAPHSKSNVSDLSSPDFASLSEKEIVRALQDANGRTHYLVKYDITKDPSGRSRCKKRKCKLCYEKETRRDVSYYCISCGENFSFCTKGSGRDCFKINVEEIRRKTRHSRDSP